MSSRCALKLHLLVLVTWFTLGKAVRLTELDLCDPRNCSRPSRFAGDPKFVCTVGKDRECKNARREFLVPNSSSDGAGPKLAGITLFEDNFCQQNYGYNFAFNFTIELPPSDTLRRTKAVILEISRKRNNRYRKKCRIFDFQHVNFTGLKEIGTHHIQYDFFTQLDSDQIQVFQLWLIALPGGENSTYNVTSNVSRNRKHTIAVATNFKNGHIHIVFEPISTLRVTSYNVSLVHLFTTGEEIAANKQVSAGDTVVDFYSIHSGLFKVQISVISSDCNGKVCMTMNSTRVAMENKELPKTTTQLMTTLTKKLTTRMTSTTIRVKSTPSLLSKTTSRHQGDVIIQPSDQSEEYERSLKIMLGTVFGVVGGVTIIIVVFCMYRKRNYPSDSHIEHLQVPDIITEDLDEKHQYPDVLMLYSCDCVAHEKVAQALAAFLMQICNCNVHIDVFEEYLIQEKGLNYWLIDNLQEADYIIILCSVGARLRCKKSMQFKSNTHQTFPDYFALAVDQVAEKMRVERAKGLSLSKFLVVYFDYSVEGDIPAQLDLAMRFQLMRDINNLFCHLHGVGTEQSKFTMYSGVSVKSYDKCDIGLRLKAAIDEAKQYFKDNPSWVEDHLEQIPCSASKKYKTKRTRHNSGEPLLMHEHAHEKNPSENLNNKTQPYNRSLTSNVEPISVSTYTVESVPITNLVHNRLNSLPSSLNSQVTFTPFSSAPNTSQSYENLSYSRKLQDMDLYGPEPTNSLYSPACHPSPQSLHTESEEGYDVQPQKGKSKSLPVVGPANKSLTVLEAEVHKEWELETKDSANSPPSDSDSSSMESELESDLKSIKIPPNFDHVYYTAKYDSSEHVYTTLYYSHKRGHSVSDIGFTPWTGSEVKVLSNLLPTLKRLPRLSSQDGSSTTSYESVMEQSLNMGHVLL